MSQHSGAARCHNTEAFSTQRDLCGNVPITVLCMPEGEQLRTQCVSERERQVSFDSGETQAFATGACGSAIARTACNFNNFSNVDSARLRQPCSAMLSNGAA